MVKIITSALVSIFVSLASAGNPYNTLHDVLFDPYKGYAPMTQPTDCNITNVHTLNNEAGGVHGVIVHDDSNGTFGGSRLGREAFDSLGNVLGFLCPVTDVTPSPDFDPRFDGAFFEMGSAPDGWSDGGSVGRDDSWTNATAHSSAPNTTSDHISEGRLVSNSSATHPDFIWRFFIDKDFWGGIADDFTQDVGFYIFYRKTGFTNDSRFLMRRAWYSDGDDLNITNGVVHGANDATLTFESYADDGDTVGYVKVFRDSSNGTNSASIRWLGFEIRSSGSFAADYTAGDSFQILGILVIPDVDTTAYNADNTVIVPKDSDGIIYCPFANNGSDGYNMNTRTSEAVCRSVASALAEITQNSDKPVSSIHNMLGENPPDSGDFIENNANLEDKWREEALPDIGITSGNLPDFVYYSYHAHDSNNGRTRMPTQRNLMQQFCSQQSYRAHVNLYDYFGGLAPDEVTGNDPFGNPYDTFTMDGNSLHPANQVTAQYMWDVILYLSLDSNANSGACSYSAGGINPSTYMHLLNRRRR